MCSLALNIKLDTPAPASRRGAGCMTDTNSVDYKPPVPDPPPLLREETHAMKTAEASDHSHERWASKATPRKRLLPIKTEAPKGSSA